MHLNSTVLFLAAAALLLAKSDGVPSVIEVHSSNAPIEVTGGEGDQVLVEDNSQSTVVNQGSRTVVQAMSGGVPIQVHVPRRASLVVVTSNGSIRVSGITGRLDLSTSNGPIVVTNLGTSEIHARTSNGSIEVGSPRGLRANLSARTSNAAVDCDYEVAMQHAGGSLLEGKIGGGGPVMDLSTSNGPIHVGTGSDGERVVSTFTPGVVR